MSLGLNPNCLERLSEVVALALGQIAVEHHMFVNFDSVSDLLRAESVLPQTSALKATLSDYISDAPVSEFIYQYLSKELRDTQGYDNGTQSIRLQDLTGYEDLNALAYRLVAEFESLPWDYAMTIPLPGEIGLLLGRSLKSFVISDALAIVTPDEGFANKFPLVYGIKERDQALAQSLGAWSGFLLGLESPKWQAQVAHLQVQVKGFVGEYGATSTIKEGVDIAKAFFGIGIALWLFAHNRTYRQNQSKAQFYLHRKLLGQWLLQKTHELDAPQ